jgi:hypothetical protein
MSEFWAGFGWGALAMLVAGLISIAAGYERTR